MRFRNTIMFSSAVLASICATTTTAKAQMSGAELAGTSVGGSDIVWQISFTMNINPFDPVAVANLLRDHRIALLDVNYWTPGLPGVGVPNTYTGVYDAGRMNTFAVLHDYNVMKSPFGGFLGFIDLISPLFGITHQQIANLATFNSSGVRAVPQNSVPFAPYDSTSFRDTYNASNFGWTPVSFSQYDDGYNNAVSPFVPLPGAPWTKKVTNGCGKMVAGDYLRRNTALYSCNYRYALALTVNGQLIFSDIYTGQVFWYTGYSYTIDDALIVQPDGDVVQYKWDWLRTLASGTAGNPGAELRVTNDGHLEIWRGSTRLVRYY